jgi:murein DD-endopeptidase MepM/ murein hydrolase activator NlpD
MGVGYAPFRDEMKTRMLLIHLLVALVVLSPGVSSAGTTPRKRVAARGSSGTIYTVQKGDTLYSIARRQNMPVAELLRLNRLSDGARILPGMRLTLGQKGAPPAAEKKTPVPRNDSGAAVFRWPVDRVVRVNHSEKDTRGIGIFIQTRPGAAVICAADGTVKRVGYMRGFGNYVVVSHPDRYITVYSMVETVSVAQGTALRSGERIGRIGEEHGGVHFQINHEGRPVDAMRLLPSRS